MAYTIKQANEYIACNKASVNKKYKPRYHMTPPVGWLNDPNGLTVYGGEYHLFYQYNPYDTVPGAMHWGHFTSRDLISYRNEGVALAPTETDETGCFSGGAIADGGALDIVYTRHYEISDIKKEQVCTVMSEDGKAFKKRIMPVFDNETLPKNISRTDFRDPFPVRVGDTFYVFIGGKDISSDKGVIVVLKGSSLDCLKYDFTIGPIYELGDMAECPSFCRVGDKDVIVVSGCHVAEKDDCYKNTHASVFIVGEMDFSGKSYHIDYVKEIDKGDTFYAPQFINGAKKPTFVAWQEMWNKPYPTHDLKHGWAGGFTVPREVEILGGDIIQRPVTAIENYMTELGDTTSVPSCSCIDAELAEGGSLIIKGDNGQIIVGNDGGVYLDTRGANNLNGCVRNAPTCSNKASVRILIDVSTIEVFVDGGKQVISSRFYIDGQLKLIKLGDTEVKVFEMGGFDE